MRTEDGYFIQRCLNGETESFAFLVDKYRESVFSFAYAKLRNFDDAEDVTQEVFLKAYEKLHTLRRWDNFAIWLHTITNNLCINLLKSNAMRAKNAGIKQNDLPIANSVSRNEDSRIELINKALDNLPEIYRQVITLYYLGDMNSEEISKFLGLSASTIRQRLSRARSELKEEMLMIMGRTFDQYKLRVGWTFRIMEMTKQIRVNPISITKGLSLGLSFAVGMVSLFFGIGQHLNLINPLEFLPISASSGETKVQEFGEYPVNVLNISDISVLSNANVNGSGLGSEAPSLQNALFMSPQAGDTWTKKADMPVWRINTSTSVINGKIYIIGGNGPGSAIEEYDPIADEWTMKKADIPDHRFYLSTSVVNEKIYVIGGTDANGNDLSTVEEYDPQEDILTRKADMPTARRALSCSAIDDKIYAIGGRISGGGIEFSTVEEYDPAKDKWTKRADMPTGKAWFSTSVVNGKIYAIGGWRDGNALSSVEEYDPKKDSWAEKASLPNPRSHISSGVVNGKIYVIGGWDQNNNVFSTIEEYNPTTDIWTKKTDMPTARYDFSVGVVNGKIYAIGGWNQGPLATVEEYNPDSTGQNLDFKGKLPTTWGEMRTASNK